MMRIALAHDSFTQSGGAERVVETLHEMFPNAPVFTLAIDKKLQAKYASWNIKTSALQRIYNIYPHFSHLLPFIPFAVSSLDFTHFDIVISSSSSFIKNIKVPKTCKHICYCHTTTRFLWIDKDYVNQEVPFGLRTIVKFFLAFLKNWDFLGAQRVNSFIANSKEVQRRISEHYERESVVIHPGIDTGFWKPTRDKQNYFLLAGRLHAHKNNEIIIKAFNELGLPLHVAGSGRQEKYLRSIAMPNIIFLGYVSDEVLRDEYSGALGFIYPQVEDFGLMPLEAAACGTPTLAFARGGALETVLPGVTGELFERYDKEKIKEIIRNWRNEKYQMNDLSRQAELFGQKRFKEQMIKFIAKL